MREIGSLQSVYDSSLLTPQTLAFDSSLQWSLHLELGSNAVLDGIDIKTDACNDWKKTLKTLDIVS